MHSLARWLQSSAGFFVFGRVWEGKVEIAFAKTGGLIPAIVQDFSSGDVLMLGFMNDVALAETQRTGEVVFFSRSRNKLWKKGESSGHVLKVRELRIDCDADTILARADAVGPGVCHERYRSCFFRVVEANGEGGVREKRTCDSESVYGREKRAGGERCAARS